MPADAFALTDARILIVDDEPANVRLLERILKQAGYARLRVTTDSRQVLPLYRELDPDLILLDLHMPHLDGFAVLDDLRAAIPAATYLPILVLTADITTAAKRRALAGGARDFVSKPFDVTEVLLRIGNLLETRFLHQELRRQNEHLEELVEERTGRLRQTEKVAEMGSLLAGVAHELNNPLTVVNGQAQLLMNQTAGGPLAERAEKIYRGAERCARIVRNFLALARQRPPEQREVELNRIVQEAVELLAYQLRVDSVEVAFDLAQDVPPLWGDPHQLQQVLVNLVGNADHAMRAAPPPRRLTLATRHERDRGAVRLEVADTGPGIPPEIRERVFEPFFTTKPAGVGTGLGLAIVQGIVESHGGTVAVQSEPGEGAVFTVELPLRAGVGAGPEPAATPPPEVVAGRAILVVDDEPEVVNILADILGGAGYRVETATSGEQALARIEDRQVDLVLTDIRMPGLDGPGFYEAIRRRRPDLARRVVFLSGDALNAQIEELLARTALPCLGKPFRAEDILRGVQRALAGDQGLGLSAAPGTPSPR